jgi:hypothetical protein
MVLEPLREEGKLRLDARRRRVTKNLRIDHCIGCSFGGFFFTLGARTGAAQALPDALENASRSLDGARHLLLRETHVEPLTQMQLHAEDKRVVMHPTQAQHKKVHEACSILPCVGLHCMNL